MSQSKPSNMNNHDQAVTTIAMQLAIPETLSWCIPDKGNSATGKDLNELLTWLAKRQPSQGTMSICFNIELAASASSLS